MCLKRNFNLNATWLVYSALALLWTAKTIKIIFIIVVIRLFIVAGIQMTGCPHSLSPFLSLYISFWCIVISVIFCLLVLFCFILFCNFSFFLFFHVVWFVYVYYLMALFSLNFGTYIHTPLHLNKCIYLCLRFGVYAYLCVHVCACVCLLLLSSFQPYKWNSLWKVCNWQKERDRVKVNNKN